MSKLIEFFTLDPSEGIIFWAQLIGFIPLILSLVTFALSKREHILISKLFSDLTSAIHFFMLGQGTGGAICTVNTARDFVFYHKSKKWASHIAVPITFGVLTLASSIIQWQGVYSLLPTIGSLLAIVGLWFSDPRKVKLINLPAIALWLIYSIIVGSISTTLINLISIITIITSLTVDLVRTHKKSQNKEVTNIEDVSVSASSNETHQITNE